jgi:competence protein ComEC
MSLFDVGFQLSFMAVLAILLFYPLFESVWSQPFLFDHRLFKWLWTMLAVSCAAQIGVAPLIAYYFGRFSCYFLLANLIVVPAATLILYLSLLVLLIPSLAYLLIYIVDALNQLLSWIAMLPGASIEGLHPTPLQVWMMYVIIGAVYLLLIRRTSPTRGWSASRRVW